MARLYSVPPDDEARLLRLAEQRLLRTVNATSARARRTERDGKNRAMAEKQAAEALEWTVVYQVIGRLISTEDGTTQRQRFRSSNPEEKGSS